MHGNVVVDAELRTKCQMGRRKLCGNERRENMGWSTTTGR